MASAKGRGGRAAKSPRLAKASVPAGKGSGAGGARAAASLSSQAYDRGDWAEVIRVTLGSSAPRSAAMTERYERAWKRLDLPERCLTGLPDRAWSLALGPGGLLAAGDVSGSLCLWGPGEQSPRWTSRAEGSVNGLAFSPDGAWLFSASSSLEAPRVWDSRTGAEPAPFDDRRGICPAIALVPDGSTLVAMHHDALEIWDVGARRLLSRIDGGEAALIDGHSCLALTPDGSAALCGTMHGALVGYDLSSGAELFRTPPSGEIATAVAPSPDGRQALVACHRRRIRRHSLPDGNPIAEPPGCQPPSDASAVAFAPNGLFYVATPVGHHGATVQEPGSLRARRFLTAPRQGRLAISADGRQIVAAGSSEGFGGISGGAVLAWEMPEGLFA